MLYNFYICIDSDFDYEIHVQTLKILYLKNKKSIRNMSKIETETPTNHYQITQLS